MNKTKLQKGKDLDTEKKQEQQLKKKVSQLDGKINNKIEELKNLRSGVVVYPFFLRGVSISPSLVDDVYDDVRKKYQDCDGRLDVILDSGGGDIDSAYNLSMLLRKVGHKKLNFIIPRWAKSAATLLACSGNCIFMGPVAELGPIDPQITELNPLEGRLEQFSPLHIDSTLDLIRNEFEKGNEKLAKGLMERLQFPLTLGSFRKSIDIGKQYLIKLLTSRMFTSADTDKVEGIAKRLTEGYANHGFCINIDEATTIGLNVKELKNKELDVVWEIHKLNKEKRKIESEKREAKIMNLIKSLPPELLDKLPENIQQKLKSIISNNK